MSNTTAYLTTFNLQTHFDTYVTDNCWKHFDTYVTDNCWKHFDKRINCSRRAISPFVTILSNSFYNNTFTYRYLSHYFTKCFQSRLLQMRCLWERVIYIVMIKRDLLTRLHSITELFLGTHPVGIKFEFLDICYINRFIKV